MSKKFWNCRRKNFAFVGASDAWESGERPPIANFLIALSEEAFLIFWVPSTS